MSDERTAPPTREGASTLDQDRALVFERVKGSTTARLAFERIERALAEARATVEREARAHTDAMLRAGEVVPCLRANPRDPAPGEGRHREEGPRDAHGPRAGHRLDQRVPGALRASPVRGAEGNERDEEPAP